MNPADTDSSIIVVRTTAMTGFISPEETQTTEVTQVAIKKQPAATIQVMLEYGVEFMRVSFPVGVALQAVCVAGAGVGAGSSQMRVVTRFSVTSTYAGVMR